jgi:hypothetical protein
MSKMEFSYTQTDMFGKVEKTYNVSTNNLVLQDILEDFELFLRGAGFVFDGIVDIVSPEEHEAEPEQTEQSNEEYVKSYSKHYFDFNRNK